MIEFRKQDVLDYLRTVSTNSINLIVIDPPFSSLENGRQNSELYAKYTSCVRPGLDYNEQGVIPRFAVNLPWEEADEINNYRAWCASWYDQCHRTLRDNSFMFIFWSLKYLYLAYQIFDVSRILFWNTPNMVASVKGDFSYDVVPIIVVRKGDARLDPSLKLDEKSSIFRIAKPQSNFSVDKKVHPQQKPVDLVKYLVKCSGKDTSGNKILDPMCGSGMIARCVEHADVMMNDMTDRYWNEYKNLYEL